PGAVRSKPGIPYSDRQWRERCPLIVCDVVSIPTLTRRCMGAEPVHEALREEQMALLVGDHGTAISKGDGSRRRKRLYVPRSRLALVYERRDGLVIRSVSSGKKEGVVLVLENGIIDDARAASRGDFRLHA